MTSRRKPSLDEMPVSKQPWATGLPRRAIQALLSEGVLTEEGFLNHKVPYTISFSAHEALEERQYRLRLERGLLDPAEPMSPQEVQETLRRGGVLFEGELPFLSLGSFSAPPEQYYRVEGGDIYLEPLVPRYPSRHELRGYHTFHFSASRKADKTFGIMRKLGWREWHLDLQLTRQIFGMEFDALEELVVAFGRALRHDISPYEWERVTCSDKSNSCDLTSNYIPPNFPYIVMEENMYWGAHISIAAFFRYVKLLTGVADARHESTKLMSVKGVGDETWRLLKETGSRFGNKHAHWNEVVEYLRQ